MLSLNFISILNPLKIYRQVQEVKTKPLKYKSSVVIYAFNDCPHVFEQVIW